MEARTLPIQLLASVKFTSPRQTYYAGHIRRNALEHEPSGKTLSVVNGSVYACLHRRNVYPYDGKDP